MVSDCSLATFFFNLWDAPSSSPIPIRHVSYEASSPDSYPIGTLQIAIANKSMHEESLHPICCPQMDMAQLSRASTIKSHSINTEGKNS